MTDSNKTNIYCNLTGFVIGQYTQEELELASQLGMDSPNEPTYSRISPALKACKGNYTLLPRNYQLAILVNTLFFPDHKGLESFQEMHQKRQDFGAIMQAEIPEESKSLENACAIAHLITSEFGNGGVIQDFLGRSAEGRKTLKRVRDFQPALSCTLGELEGLLNDIVDTLINSKSGGPRTPSGWTVGVNSNLRISTGPKKPAYDKFDVNKHSNAKREKALNPRKKSGHTSKASRELKKIKDAETLKRVMAKMGWGK